MHYEQFITGDNPKILSLLNNIKNGILVMAVVAYILFGSVIAIGFVVLYFIVSMSTLNIYVEYEYELTDSELDIFKISNKKKRKLVKCLDLNKSEGPISSRDFNPGKYNDGKVIKLYTKKYEDDDKQIIVLKEAGGTKVYELVLNEELLGYVSRISRIQS